VYFYALIDRAEELQYKMANVKQQLASLANSSGPSQKDRIEKYVLCTASITGIVLSTLFCVEYHVEYY